jgi:tripartite-type tricarboxylate transporter receptor subunit TctC
MLQTSRMTKPYRMIGLLGAAFVLGVAPAHAQSPEEFYKGKTITFAVGFGPGGGYDLYARVIGHHIGRHIPGNPSVIVQNAAGAGSIRAANNVYATAPKDGTVVATVVQDIALFQLLGSSGVQYDAARFNWLGGVVASNSTLYTWHTTGITSWEQARTREVVLGSTGVTSSMVARTLNAVLGTKFKLVQGYPGTPEINLAMQRGEMMGSGGTTWAGLQVSSHELIEKKLLNFLVQTGARKEAALPDVPLLLDLARSEEDRQIMSIVSLPSAIGYAYWLPPEVPAERVDLLRRAFDATMRDPEFIADAEGRNLLLRPQAAETLRALIAKAVTTPKPVLERTKIILEW